MFSHVFSFFLAIVAVSIHVLKMNGPRFAQFFLHLGFGNCSLSQICLTTFSEHAAPFEVCRRYQQLGDRKSWSLKLRSMAQPPPKLGTNYIL